MSTVAKAAENLFYVGVHCRFCRCLYKGRSLTLSAQSEEEAYSDAVCMAAKGGWYRTKENHAVCPACHGVVLDIIETDRLSREGSGQ